MAVVLAPMGAAWAQTSGGACLADLEACLAPGEHDVGQDVCIDKCEMECLGQMAKCIQTPRCARCLARAFVGCGVGDRACIEARVPPLRGAEPPTGTRHYYAPRGKRTALAMAASSPE